MWPLPPHVGPREGRVEVDTSDFVPLYGTSEKTGVMSPSGPGLGHFSFCACAWHWRTPRRQGLCHRFGHICAIFDFVLKLSTGYP